MHFCVFTARVYARFSWPRKIGLNWFMPALVKSNVGSSCGTTGDDGTKVCPCRCTKKSMNCWRISEEVMVAFAKNLARRNESRIIHERGGADKRPVTCGF